MPAATAAKREQKNGQLVNPFYSPSFVDNGDERYEYAQYKVRCSPGPRDSSYLLNAHPRQLAFLSGPLLGAAGRGQSDRKGPAGESREEKPLVGGV